MPNWHRIVRAPRYIPLPAWQAVVRDAYTDLIDEGALSIEIRPLRTVVIFVAQFPHHTDIVKSNITPERLRSRWPWTLNLSL